jgi:pilus assembly protein CpaF
MDNMFSQMDFGALKEYLDNDDITDISYANGGQIYLKTLSRGNFRTENDKIDNAFMEKLAFQCANVMGKSFNMAYPRLDAESAELRMNFIHDSVATNGIAVLIRKTPAKIRLVKEKILEEKYITLEIHDFLVKCVEGHCNMFICGETGSGKTELLKYLGSKIKETEKIITVEDTLELHLDRIFPHRDIVALKTNNIVSYSDILVACMRQNPKWILLSEVRSAEAVMAVRNAISSGHYILSTIHADKASSIPNRMYSLLETNQDIDQFLRSIYRYIQIGVYVRGYQDKETKRFVREISEVTEFYVTEDNEAKYNIIYKKDAFGKEINNDPSQYLIDYLAAQGVMLPAEMINRVSEKHSQGIDPGVGATETIPMPQTASNDVETFEI